MKPREECEKWGLPTLSQGVPRSSKKRLHRAGCPQFPAPVGQVPDLSILSLRRAGQIPDLLSGVTP